MDRVVRLNGASGDYATGGNHVLPTGGFAKMFSPLSVESFGRKVQVQKLSRSGLGRIRSTVECLAETEGLIAHKNSIAVRFNRKSSPQRHRGHEG